MTSISPVDFQYTDNRIASHAEDDLQSIFQVYDEAYPGRHLSANPEFDNEVAHRLK